MICRSMRTCHEFADRRSGVPLETQPQRRFDFWVVQAILATGAVNAAFAPAPSDTVVYVQRAVPGPVMGEPSQEQSRHEVVVFARGVRRHRSTKSSAPESGEAWVNHSLPFSPHESSKSVVNGPPVATGVLCLVPGLGANGRRIVAAPSGAAQLRGAQGGRSKAPRLEGCGDDGAQPRVYPSRSGGSAPSAGVAGEPKGGPNRACPCRKAGARCSQVPAQGGPGVPGCASLSSSPPRS